MKYLITIFLFSLFSSCKSDLTNKETDFENVELSGIWRFQSSTDDYVRDHQIIILDDSTYYKFSRTNGGGLIEKGLLSKNDSLINEQGLKHGLKKIDTNEIEIENHYNFFGEFTNTYERTSNSNYNDELNKYLKIDSIRNKALGWWKLSKSKLPVELVNYSGKFDRFTMHINDDGTATFYLENYLDSVVNYGYRIREKNRIDLIRGDVMGGGTKIYIESDTIMKIIMKRRSLDTLELKRIYKLK